MKTTAIIITILLCISMVHYSCKSSANKNDYCVKVIQNSPTVRLLSESEMNVIRSLFESNRMAYANYQFYQLDTDDLGFHHVKCYQFVNNLRVFSEDLSFHFNKNNAHYLSSGNLINSIGLDAKPSLNQNKVAEIFIRKIEQENAAMVDATVLKGCFEIELGHIGLDDSSGKFAKAWKAKPTDRDYPYAYINDDNSEILFYDNGVRF